MDNFHIKHIAYAGLGGHANLFFVMQNASKQAAKNSVVFYGIEPIADAYKEKCEQEKIDYTYVHKRQGLDIKYYINIYKAIANSDAQIIFLHNSGLILPAFFARIFKDKKIIVRETHANHLKTKADWVFLVMAFWLANRTVILSKAYLQELKDKLGWLIRPKKARIIPNGLDIDYFKADAAKVDSNFITIGMQSRLVPIKDHIALVKAIGILAPKYPNIKLVIAGDGTTRKSIEELVQTLQLESHIELTGMLNATQLLEMLQSLDIYVHSTLGETMSNAIMQAQSVGLPVIATNVKGVNNVIEHDKNGFLFELHDEQTLAEQIDLLIRNIDKRNALANASRIYAEEKLSDKVMMQSYLNLFKEVLCI